mmetsp:Transcript_41682/g.137313  ORF Transcript_41682/g.137313 Transcript_41682/m.137313 type:complete len:269 (-) Transcript_41682:1832-2638(-)
MRGTSACSSGGAAVAPAARLRVAARETHQARVIPLPGCSSAHEPPPSSSSSGTAPQVAISSVVAQSISVARDAAAAGSVAAAQARARGGRTRRAAILLKATSAPASRGVSPCDCSSPFVSEAKEWSGPSVKDRQTASSRMALLALHLARAARSQPRHWTAKAEPRGMRAPQPVHRTVKTPSDEGSSGVDGGETRAAPSAEAAARPLPRATAGSAEAGDGGSSGGGARRRWSPRVGRPGGRSGRVWTSCTAAACARARFMMDAFASERS